MRDPQMAPFNAGHNDEEIDLDGFTGSQLSDTQANPHVLLQFEHHLIWAMSINWGTSVLGQSMVLTRKFWGIPAQKILQTTLGDEPLDGSIW